MEIDSKEFENEYSRQIGAYGMETMGKLIKMEVFIQGLRGLGIETAKNIILAGPKRVVLYDPTIVLLNDLGSNFYLTEDQVGKSRRDNAVVNRLKELNPRVTVEVADFDPCKDISHLKQFNVACITEVSSTDYITKVDEVMREVKGALVYAAATGLSGFVFTDFGKEFLIRDKDGEECKQYIVKNVSKSDPGIILIDENIGGKLAYSDGDYVSFKEITGMNELNDGNPRQIKYISPVAFSIEDTSKYGEYISGGIVEQVKVPKARGYRSFAESFETPYLQDGKVPDPTDYAKFGRNELLHISFKVLHDYYKKHNSLPCQQDHIGIEPYVEVAKQMFTSGREAIFWIKNSQEFDADVVKKVLNWSASHIVPVTSFMGGIVAQEIVKFTGKYTPIDQWLWFDFFEAAANLPEDTNKTPLKSRYDDQIAIFGRDIQEKLENMNIFMIGAGALGCEFLKEFALMGISCKNGVVTCTDNDHIEISNLNRQFLFRHGDVKKPKSKIACNSVKKFNKNFNTNDLQTLVTQENEHIFTDDFWEKQHFIINAVDNIKARKYIDNMATWYGKPLIDSGTLGTKAHSQLIYPHVTNCYNDMTDPPEEGIAMCTLHNFPAMIEHCIEYGRDAFNGHFTDTVSDSHKLMENTDNFLKEVLKDDNKTVQYNRLNSVKDIIHLAESKSFDKCIEFAFNAFVALFDHRIKQLLYNFPPEYVNEDGSKFWVGSKRVPSPIDYDVKDELCLLYVGSYALLIAQSLSIKTESMEYISNYSSKLKIPEFIPQKVQIKLVDNEADAGLSNEDENKLANIINELTGKNKSNIDSKSLVPQEFEKDEDENHHIDFIHACSNLRARNYKIKECDRLRTKIIAGKIIPAIATTTASITGLVALQILTCLQTDKLDYMRGAYLNLAVNLFVMTEPGPVIHMKDKEYDQILLGPVKAIPANWTVWDKIVIKKSLTYKELFDHFENTYNLEVSIVASKGLTLYMSFNPNAKDKLNIKIEDDFASVSKKENLHNYLILDVSCDTKDGDSAIIPLVKYIFKN